LTGYYSQMFQLGDVPSSPKHPWQIVRSQTQSY
jgi:hypothetical protein